MFVSSQTFSALLGGVVGADQSCQGLADNAGLGGSWKAWISDSSSSPSTRFARPTTAYTRIDGTLVAMHWAGLTSGALTNSVLTEEYGAPVPNAEVWTATTTSGTYGGNSCSDWSRNDGTPLYPQVGISDRSSSEWTAAYLQFFDRVARLYCVEQ